MFSRTLALRSNVVRMAVFQQPRFAPSAMQVASQTSRRAFSARSDLLKALDEEISEEQSLEKKPTSSSGPFKLAEDLPDKVTLKHTVKGMNIVLSFDAAELKYDFDEETDEGEEELHKRLPIRVEITPAASKNSVVIAGEILCRESASDEEGVEDEDDIPFFTPSTCIVGDEEAIKLGYTPDIDELSEEIQDNLSNWLTELDVNEKVFTQAFELASERENKLYSNWLQGLKAVVDAGKK
ncbi:hypothetical protein BASA81_003997 [Batrachochytrium salamandrivorans]|nr:hypothetical protein BASA81_003997 [Batrachochytrium salamandrivorans]